MFLPSVSPASPPPPTPPHPNPKRNPKALAQRAKLLRMMGQCEEAAKDYAALEVIDPKHADLETLYPLAKTCAQHLVEGAAAEARKDWQVGGADGLVVVALGGWGSKLVHRGVVTSMHRSNA